MGLFDKINNFLVSTGNEQPRRSPAEIEAQRQKLQNKQNYGYILPLPFDRFRYKKGNNKPIISNQSQTPNDTKPITTTQVPPIIIQFPTNNQESVNNQPLINKPQVQEVKTQETETKKQMPVNKTGGNSFNDWFRAQVKAGNYNTVQDYNGKKYHIIYGDEMMHNKAMKKASTGRTAEQYRRIENNEDWNGGV
jgi:hypothetical protein